MGRLKKGLLGGVSGTVGPIVGSNWKGIETIRSRPTVRKNKKSTPRQLIQQAKFATASHFTRPFNTLLMETYNGSSMMTGANTGLSDILKRAVAGIYPAFHILYSKVFLSRGSLPNAESATSTSTAGGTVTFTWTNYDTALGKALPSDQVLMIVYCEELNQAIYRKGNEREQLTDMLHAGAFKGRMVQTWLSFLSKDSKDIADSIYTGEIQVAV